MDEYIEREVAIKAIRDSDPYGVRRALGFRETDIEETLRSVPAADVAPVRHGRWTWNAARTRPFCSECCVEPWRASNFVLPNYCPHCGARMDGAE